jgi:protein-disulfide isomerase-like protein with CxxC motif
MQTCRHANMQTGRNKQIFRRVQTSRYAEGKNKQISRRVQTSIHIGRGQVQANMQTRTENQTNRQVQTSRYTDGYRLTGIPTGTEKQICRLDTCRKP